MGGQAVLGVLALSIFSCAATGEPPPPRYAEVPPPAAPAAGSRDAGRRDSGAPAPTDAGPVQPDASLSAADAPAPATEALIVATAPMTSEQWRTMLSLGRRKFNVTCGGCHSTGIGPGLVGRRMSADHVRRQIREGGGEMRPISVRRLSDQELEAVLVFLSTIRGVTDVAPLAQ